MIWYKDEVVEPDYRRLLPVGRKIQRYVFPVTVR